MFLSCLGGSWYALPALHSVQRSHRKQVKSFEAMAARLASGDASLLGEVHAITSGLKILVSSTGVQDLETARRSMGGHGYSAFAGLGRLYADYLPSVTYVRTSCSQSES